MYPSKIQVCPIWKGIPRTNPILGMWVAIPSILWEFPEPIQYMGVSETSGTPKSSIKK